MLSIKDFSITRIVLSISILILVSGSLSFSGEILDDFEDGDTVGWENAPLRIKIARLSGV